MIMWEPPHQQLDHVPRRLPCEIPDSQARSGTKRTRRDCAERASDGNPQLCGGDGSPGLQEHVRRGLDRSQVHGRYRLARTSANSVALPLRAEPATTIRPSGWITTSCAESMPAKKSIDQQNSAGGETGIEVAVGVVTRHGHVEGAAGAPRRLADQHDLAVGLRGDRAADRAVAGGEEAGRRCTGDFRRRSPGC